MSLGGLMMFSILFTTGDSRTISKTFGHGPIHRPYSLTLSLKLNKQISATGNASMRRRRSLCLENLPPPSRRLLIRNPSPACPPNLASPPDPHHCQLPAKLLQPCRPCHEHWLRQPTPTKTCLLSSDWTVLPTASSIPLLSLIISFLSVLFPNHYAYVSLTGLILLIQLLMKSPFRSSLMLIILFQLPSW